jgi:hypothetical protein
MSYLVENIKYQYSPVFFQLEKLENDLRKKIHSISVTNPADSKEQLSSILKRSEAQLNSLQSQSKGINWTFFFLGLAAYHTQHIFRKKVLLNEMGSKALPHLAICAAVGLASGSLVGYSTASNLKTYRKYNSIKKQLERAVHSAK